MLAHLGAHGWADAVDPILTGHTSPDDVAAVARAYVLRAGGQPLLTVGLHTAVHDSPEQAQRWTANIAYNHRSPFVLVLSNNDASLLFTQRYRPIEANRALDSNQWAGVELEDGPAAVFAFAQSSTAELDSGWFQVASADRLMRRATIADIERLAARDGFVRRGTVDQVLLDHCFGFRAEALRADEYGDLSREDRSHFDAALVQLFARILFIRHLEDHGHADWRRGDLLQLLDASASPADCLTQIFADLNSRFNSELFPAAVPLAYRIVGVSNRLIRQFVSGLYASPQHGVAYDFRALESDSLGLLYQQFAGIRWPEDSNRGQLRLLGKDGLVAEQIRTKFGIYYTPEYIVDTLLTLTVERWLSERSIKAVGEPGGVIPRVLDLTAGSGVFLTRAYRAARRRAGNEWPLIADRWVQALHGADIDPRAITLARLNLWIEYAREFPDTPLPPLARTLRVADSLLSTSEADASGRDGVAGLPGEWVERGFDVIVGNPPFLANRGAVSAFGRTRVDLWRAQFQSARHETNMASFFVERALGLLRPGGFLGMVVPRNLIKTESGEALRRLIRCSFEVVCIMDLLDARISHDAKAATVLLVLRRPDEGTPRSASGKAVIIGSLTEQPALILATACAGQSGPNVHCRDIDLASESRLLVGRVIRSDREAPWILEDRTGHQVLDQLLGAGSKLTDYYRPSYAVDEGLRGAFLLQDVKDRGDVIEAWSAARGMRVEIETVWIRAAITAPNIGLLGQLQPELECPNALIYPYNASTGEPATWEQIAEFPLLAAHLRTIQVPLVKRRGHGATDGWWMPLGIRKSAPWHRPANHDNISVILQRRHAAWPHVAVVGSQKIPVGNIVGWIGKTLQTPPMDFLDGTSPRWLDPWTGAGLLSSLLWWWFAAVFGTVGDTKLYRVPNSVLGALSVPPTLLREPSHLGEVGEIVRLASRAGTGAAGLSRIWDAVDDAVFTAYGISDAGRIHIRAVARVYAQNEARERAIRAFVNTPDQHRDQPDLFNDLGRSNSLSAHAPERDERSRE